MGICRKSFKYIFVLVILGSALVSSAFAGWTVGDDWVIASDWIYAVEEGVPVPAVVPSVFDVAGMISNIYVFIGLLLVFPLCAVAVIFLAVKDVDAKTVLVAISAIIIFALLMLLLFSILSRLESIL